MWVRRLSQGEKIMLRLKLSEIATLQTGLVLNRKEARHEETTERVYRSDYALVK